MSADAGLFTLFLLVLADSLGVPAPGDTALLAAGALAAEGRLPLVPVIAVATAAAIVGDSIVYWVGRRGGRRVLQREGRWASHRHAALARADRFYAQYGLLAVFFTKFIPGVRAVGPLVAGTAEMPWIPFVLVNAAACAAWTTLAAVAGYALGLWAVAIAVGAFVLTMAAIWLIRRARERRAVAGDDPAVAVARD
ncbi:MAG: DedA family protein [Solirubrobacteraceae bacterium]|nr:DedA family protein [Solirubrobacteraceae bacterium]